ncbi:unnamed protein product [Nezara viridula]|uniref:Uncharacterized protein n=1 Tax=Nezara viridula TaxID=85310 RepID=A0A9P0MU10_NEZVI|nr:unnamed protein product [Nezara viridula]
MGTERYFIEKRYSPLHYLSNSKYISLGLLYLDTEGHEQLLRYGGGGNNLLNELGGALRLSECSSRPERASSHINAAPEQPHIGARCGYAMLGSRNWFSLRLLRNGGR